MIIHQVHSLNVHLEQVLKHITDITLVLMTDMVQTYMAGGGGGL